jgi:FtsP/CotA-like multicopper oxidase with cupredoxin domain
MPHPIHAHGVRFQVIERINGEPLAPRDYGWKDTVIVWGEEMVRVIVRFDAYEGMFLFHCHNLEHEDEGMMINFEIGEGDSDVGIEERIEGLDLR